MEMKTKEQLLYHCLAKNLRLSNYDYRFLSNLQTMITANARVTMNQAALFDKLMRKYSKQLSKIGLQAEDIQQLEWKTPLVESLSLYTSARVNVDGDDIVLKVPFNRQFISHVNMNSKDAKFKFDTVQKEYRAPFTTSALKWACENVPAFFKEVAYCDQISGILNDLSTYTAGFWNPTLTQVGDMLVVMACNQHTASAISHIPLKNDAITFYQLSLHGVAIDPVLLGDDPFLVFASSSIASVEITELEQVFDWIKELNCETVAIGRGLTYHASTASITDSLSQRGITAHASGNLLQPTTFVNPTAVMYLQHARTLMTGTHSYGKIIMIKDSRPIGTK